jgi:hypothetical protein
MHAKSSSKVHIVLSVLLSFDEMAKYALYDKLGMAITMDLHHAAEIQNLLRRKKAYHEFWYRNKGRKKHTFWKVFIFMSCTSLIYHIQATKFIIPNNLPSISNQEVGQTLNNPITNRDASHNICKRADAHGIKHVYIEFRNFISAVDALRKLSSHIIKLGPNQIQVSKYNRGNR